MMKRSYKYYDVEISSEEHTPDKWQATVDFRTTLRSGLGLRGITV